ncbi:hypothetical protein Ddye_029417 [Dipteronia dyeriana]|uniref:Uncharacterized protein n=1 Tax=Dipteronia dyeriana TaxID=168575 RepID=A0AAD9TED9_9ROSI|nr:hypothetical protein Ddye_029417 [Dipteronia dyeriana]
MNNHHQQQEPSKPQPLIASGGDCGNCEAHLRGLLHNVQLHDTHRKLCTSCVLRLHPSSFSPVCFAFYDSKPPHPSKRFACSNNDASVGGGRRIYGKSVAVILCATRTASSSMAKAEAVVWIEADKKAKVATFARKCAREALERVALLITKDNVTVTQNNNGGIDGSAQLSGSAASFFKWKW